MKSVGEWTLLDLLFLGKVPHEIPSHLEMNLYTLDEPMKAKLLTLPAIAIGRGAAPNPM